MEGDVSLKGAGAKPWYREPWPWLLAAGPAAAVVGGLITLWVAVATEDGLVADDYYKRGLAINRMLARDRAAAALRYRARVGFDAGADRVRVALAGSNAPSRPLRLLLTHSTRAGLDRVALLLPRAAGEFEGRLAVPQDGRWIVTLEDSDATWRLAGEWRAPQPVLDLAPRKP